MAGAFMGCAFNGSVVSTRNSINDRFYGGRIKASEILLGSLPRPPAAAALYKALSILFDKIEK
jgi:SH3 domain-containing YSC84-like protein 1